MMRLLFLICLFGHFIHSIFGRTTIAGLTQANPTVSLTGSWSQQMELYELDWTSDLSTLEYVIFEVTISGSNMSTILTSSSLNPMLCFEFDTDPTLTYTSSTNTYSPCQNGFNYNQYTRASGQYSVDITTNGSYSSIVLGVYIEVAIASYQLIVKGKFSSNSSSICPFDCGLTGSLVALYCENRTCNCPVGKVDYDCSTIAAQIKSDVNLQLTVSKANFVYAYYVAAKDQDYQSVQVKFKLQNQPSSANVYISTYNITPLKIVPDENNFYQEISVDSYEYVYSIQPSLLFDSSNNPQKVIFGIILKANGAQIDNNMITLTVIQDTNSVLDLNSIIVYSLVGVTGLLLLVWTVLLILRICNKNTNQVHDIRVLALKNESNRLTADQIEQYMPVIIYSDVVLKQQRQQRSVSDSCAVCLGEFSKSELCREAICAHVFHKDCLGQWLTKQENCPFCRADLSKNALVKHHQIKLQQGGSISESDATSTRLKVIKNQSSNSVIGGGGDEAPSAMAPTMVLNLAYANQSLFCEQTQPGNESPLPLRIRDQSIDNNRSQSIIPFRRQRRVISQKLIPAGRIDNLPESDLVADNSLIRI